MPRVLRAGSWSLEIDDLGVLRGVRLNGEEVLRGLAGVVRDADWGTVPGDVTFEEFSVDRDSFNVVFRSEHGRAGCDFGWTGTLTGSADSVLTFAFDGQARSAVRSNRIGLVALHSLNWAGRPVRVVHTDGTADASHYPRLVSPHQPFLDVRAFRQPTLSGAEVEIAFDGDVFETEDQRNWSDASFKTYSRPLALPYPVEYAAGDRVTQSVTLRVSTAPSVRAPHDAEDGSEPVNVTLGAPDAPWPRIGLGLAPVRDTAADAATVALAPAWLRVDLRLDADGTLHGTDALAHVGAMGLPVELALTIADPPPVDFSELTEVLQRDVVEHILVYTDNSPSTSASSVSLVRLALGDASGAAPGISAGTDGNLAELNRFPLDVECTDGITLSINAQVHDISDQSVMQTTEAYATMIATARAHGHAGSATAGLLTVSPVTLRPRRNLYATTRPSGADEDIDPASVDPRQATPFAAAWAVAAIASLAAAGVDRLTLFEHTGPRGVFARGGAPHPVHAVLEIALAAEHAISLQTDHSSITGFAVRNGGRRTVALANTSTSERTVRVPQLSAGTRVIGGYEILILSDGEA